MFNLKQLMYNPCTGLFYKKEREIGWTRKDGYVFISAGRKHNGFGLILAHRLAWFKIYGRWPKEIDHIDGNPSNNSIWNLREVDHQQNLLNSEFHRRGGKSRRPGHWHPRRYYLDVRS